MSSEHRLGSALGDKHFDGCDNLLSDQSCILASQQVPSASETWLRRAAFKYPLAPTNDIPAFQAFLSRLFLETKGRGARVRVVPTLFLSDAGVPTAWYFSSPSGFLRRKPAHSTSLSAFMQQAEAHATQLREKDVAEATDGGRAVAVIRDAYATRAVSLQGLEKIVRHLSAHGSDGATAHAVATDQPPRTLAALAGGQDPETGHGFALSKSAQDTLGASVMEVYNTARPDTQQSPSVSSRVVDAVETALLAPPQCLQLLPASVDATVYTCAVESPGGDTLGLVHATRKNASSDRIPFQAHIPVDSPSRSWTLPPHDSLNAWAHPGIAPRDAAKLPRRPGFVSASGQQKTDAERARKVLRSRTWGPVRPDYIENAVHPFEGTRTSPSYRTFISRMHLDGQPVSDARADAMLQRVVGGLLVAMRQTQEERQAAIRGLMCDMIFPFEQNAVAGRLPEPVLVGITGFRIAPISQRTIQPMLTGKERPGPSFLQQTSPSLVSATAALRAKSPTVNVQGRPAGVNTASSPARRETDAVLSSPEPSPEKNKTSSLPSPSRQDANVSSSTVDNAQPSASPVNLPAVPRSNAPRYQQPILSQASRTAGQAPLSGKIAVSDGEHGVDERKRDFVLEAISGASESPNRKHAHHAPLASSLRDASALPLSIEEFANDDQRIASLQLGHLLPQGLASPAREAPRTSGNVPSRPRSAVDRNRDSGFTSDPAKATEGNTPPAKSVKGKWSAVRAATKFQMSARRKRLEREPLIHPDTARKDVVTLNAKAVAATKDLPRTQQELIDLLQRTRVPIGRYARDPFEAAILCHLQLQAGAATATDMRAALLERRIAMLLKQVEGLEQESAVLRQTSARTLEATGAARDAATREVTALKRQLEEMTQDRNRFRDGARDLQQTLQRTQLERDAERSAATQSLLDKQKLLDQAKEEGKEMSTALEAERAETERLSGLLSEARSAHAGVVDRLQQSRAEAQRLEESTRAARAKLKALKNQMNQMGILDPSIVSSERRKALQREEAKRAKARADEAEAQREAQLQALKAAHAAAEAARRRALRMANKLAAGDQSSSQASWRHSALEAAIATAQVGEDYPVGHVDAETRHLERNRRASGTNHGNGWARTSGQHGAGFSGVHFVGVGTSPAPRLLSLPPTTQAPPGRTLRARDAVGVRSHATDSPIPHASPRPPPGSIHMRPPGRRPVTARPETPRSPIARPSTSHATERPHPSKQASGREWGEFSVISRERASPSPAGHPAISPRGRLSPFSSPHTGVLAGELQSQASPATNSVPATDGPRKAHPHRPDGSKRRRRLSKAERQSQQERQQQKAGVLPRDAIVALRAVRAKAGAELAATEAWHLHLVPMAELGLEEGQRDVEMRVLSHRLEPHDRSLRTVFNSFSSVVVFGDGNSSELELRLMSPFEFGVLLRHANLSLRDPLRPRSPDRPGHAVKATRLARGPRQRPPTPRRHFAREDEMPTKTWLELLFQTTATSGRESARGTFAPLHHRAQGLAFHEWVSLLIRLAGRLARIECGVLPGVSTEVAQRVGPHLADVLQRIQSAPQRAQAAAEAATEMMGGGDSPVQT